MKGVTKDIQKVMIYVSKIQTKKGLQTITQYNILSMYVAKKKKE